MPSETTALTKTTHHEALDADDARRLAAALEDSADATMFVNGTSVRLPEGALDAVLDLLARLAAGDAITLSTAERWLNTSQAARLAGVSNTYLRRLTDTGAIPVHYRGSHRRVRPEDVAAWAAARETGRLAGPREAPDGRAANDDGMSRPTDDGMSRPADEGPKPLGQRRP